MTLSQLHCLPWKMVSHLAMEHEHASAFTTEIDGLKIGKCVHVLKKNDYDFGRSYTHYMINGKVYKTHKSAVERINELLAEKGDNNDDI